MYASPRIRFAHQVLALQVAVVVLVAGVGYALVAWLMRDELRHQYGQRALTLARGVAADPVLADEVEQGDPGRLVQQRAEQVRRASGALFVVVTDRNGIRFSHTNPTLIGRRVSTDPSEPLAGKEVVAIERGTLGLSARGKVPLRDRAGAIAGEVSVGFDAGDVDRRVSHTLASAGLFTAGALLLGVGASYAIGRRLKRQTLGLEPYELAELVQEREAVLHGVGEGVLAIDPHGRVAMCNAEAARLLGSAPERGAPVTELPAPERLKAVLEGTREAQNLLAAAGERVLVVNRREVRHNGKDLGAVITLRDRTDLEVLARELGAVRTLFDALRAQRHEYANRLHTLSGLLNLGHHEEAAEYVRTLVEVPEAGDAPSAAMPDPYLQAFLAAKGAVAAEKGVRLEIGEGSWVPGRVIDPLDVTTVIGNLVDNALEAARLGERRPARVEVELLGDGSDLYATVSDSGDGVPDELREAIFHDGVSTRPETADRPRGLGLALARQAARARGGNVTLADPGGAAADAADAAGTGSAGGATFVLRLPGVLTEEVVR
jgi:two-component system CitB family sensor kinase